MTVDVDVQSPEFFASKLAPTGAVQAGALLRPPVIALCRVTDHFDDALRDVVDVGFQGEVSGVE